MKKSSGKGEKYYLIEKYTEYDESDRFSTFKYTAYDMTGYSTLEQLKEALLKGSRHGGKLMPAKGLELKLEAEEEYPELPLQELERQLQKHYNGRL